MSGDRIAWACAQGGERVYVYLYLDAPAARVREMAAKDRAKMAAALRDTVALLEWDRERWEAGR